jgi:TRAP-type mannitol/chloroaromatic compound transport system permease small subunit
MRELGEGGLSDAGATRDVTSAAEELLEEVSHAKRRAADEIEVPGGITGILYRLRVGIEAVTTVTGHASWVLVWVVFILGLFNVVTRYVARFIERDIIVGEVFDLQWMMFGALFLLGLNYGVREGVNPRIDFWWAHFSAKKKAIIDLLAHSLLFLPFLIMAIRTLWGWSMTAMGRRFDGSWPTWKVWEIWEQSTDAGGLPRGPIKLLILIGFILMATQVVAEIIKQILVLMEREDLAGVAEYEAPLRVE